ncbi:hypothetical protein CIPAW_09G054700 [Carya illinoinensis]|uniref:Uncharacterized protein n=1 Tax=Carya illinoinensis TaxID=32201 RepID=A0A8T1PHI2_CARIL|nr:hypothetical protein CIPAW_09G054700 [Carya illinoinensis]
MHIVAALLLNLPETACAKTPGDTPRIMLRIKRKKIRADLERGKHLHMRQMWAELICLPKI